jgi:hypothetical protein
VGSFLLPRGYGCVLIRWGINKGHGAAVAWSRAAAGVSGCRAAHAGKRGGRAGPRGGLGRAGFFYSLFLFFSIFYFMLFSFEFNFKHKFVD